MSIAIENDVRTLDHLLTLLSKCSTSDGCGLLQEHVQEARTYLLGAMNAEYKFNLELARQGASEIPDGRIRSEFQKALAGLLDETDTI